MARMKGHQGGKGPLPALLDRRFIEEVDES
jgi:hypothetical protein